MIGQLHQPLRLAVAFGPRHAEIVLDAGFGVGALLLADDDHGIAAEPAQPADHRGILGKGAVAGERREVIDQFVDVVETVRPVGVARHLHLLPRRQLGVGLTQGAVDAGLQLGDLVGNLDVADVGQVAQLLHLAIKFGD